MEVILSTRSRRRFAPDEKLRIVEESFQPGNSMSAVARKYDMHPSQLFQWRKLVKDGQMEAIKAEERLVPESEVKALEKRIRELERALGRKTLHYEVLKEAVKIGRQKKLISDEPLRGLEDFE